MQMFSMRDVINMVNIVICVCRACCSYRI